MDLTVTARSLVHLDPGTAAWVDLAEAAFTGQPDDSAVLDALLRHPLSEDSFAGEPDGQGRHGLHGPFRLAALDPASFVRTPRDAAVARLEEWVGEVGAQEATRRRALREVTVALGGDPVYELRAPAGARHEWGDVVGAVAGFHEYVVIDRAASRLRRIVAADD